VDLKAVKDMTDLKGLLIGRILLGIFGNVDLN
jgi:hypothetical protein